jgi:hypothetical protein
MALLIPMLIMALHFMRTAGGSPVIIIIGVLFAVVIDGRTPLTGDIQSIYSMGDEDTNKLFLRQGCPALFTTPCIRG